MITSHENREYTTLIYNTTLVRLLTQFTTIQLQITAITIYNGNTTTYTTYTT